METWMWVVIVAGAAVVVAIIAMAWQMQRSRRSKRLRESFGPEYERTVKETGDRSKAESELEGRRQRVEKLNIRPLSEDEQSRFAASWQATQSRFVDDPSSAIRDAEGLVTEVMSARGYPVADFEQRAADVSVDHPEVVANYRFARRIAQANEEGEASTEELRQGLVHYRALFAELLEKQPARH
jgi:hypothetical protein